MSIVTLVAGYIGWFALGTYSGFLFWKRLQQKFVAEQQVVLKHALDGSLLLFQEELRRSLEEYRNEIEERVYLLEDSAQAIAGQFTEEEVEAFEDEICEQQKKKEKLH